MAQTLNLGNGNWATKEGSLLGYNSENNNYKPLPFDFSRASSSTVVNKDGLIETVGSGQARVDYKDDTKGALLLEPSRSNLETKSNEFSTWGTNSNTTRTADYIISPDGTLNGTRLQFTANGFCGNTTQVNTTQYTISCYAKRNDSGTQNVGFFTNGSGVVNSAWEITSEWKRFTYTYTSGNTSFVGISGDSGADISVYGFQIEVGSYPTSYIPTQGSAVTRLADSCNQGGNDQVINSSEGVLYAEISALADIPTSDQYVTLGDGARTSPVSLRFSSLGEIIYYHGGLNSVNIVSTIASGNVDLKQINKIALRYGTTASDCSLFFNGTKQSTYGSFVFSALSTLNQLSFSEDLGGSNFYGKTKDIRVYNEALTDQELQALTTI